MGNHNPTKVADITLTGEKIEPANRVAKTNLPNPHTLPLDNATQSHGGTSKQRSLKDEMVTSYDSENISNNLQQYREDYFLQ